MKSTKIPMQMHFDYVKDLDEADIGQILRYVLGIAPDEDPMVSVCLHCGKYHMM